MEYVRLGGTGLQVSRLILGCGNFGGIGSAPAFYGMGEQEPDAIALMDHAWEHGIRVFDTADAYGGGRSESYIGRWIHAKGSAVRDGLVLSSKGFNPVGPGPNERGLSRVHITRQIDASLKRLQTDRVDLYLIHEPDPDTPIEETLDTLNGLVRAGKVLYIGASNIDAWQVARANGLSLARNLARFDFVQNSYSLLDRDQEREMLPFCRATGVGFTAFGPLAGGWLTGKYRAGHDFPAGSRMTLRPEPYREFVSDAVFRSLAAFQADARRRKLAASTLALSWVLGHPHVNAAVIGPRKTAHLDEAIAALGPRLTDAEREAVTALFG